MKMRATTHTHTNTRSEKQRRLDAKSRKTPGRREEQELVIHAVSVHAGRNQGQSPHKPREKREEAVQQQNRNPGYGEAESQAHAHNNNSCLSIMTNHRQLRLPVPCIEGVEYRRQYHQQNGDCRENEQETPVHTFMLPPGKTVKEKMRAPGGFYPPAHSSTPPLAQSTPAAAIFAQLESLAPPASRQKTSRPAVNEAYHWIKANFQSHALSEDANPRFCSVSCSRNGRVEEEN